MSSRRLTNRDKLEEDLSLRHGRTLSTLSSGSIDARLAASDSETSLASYEEQNELGQSDVRMTTLPRTTYSASPSGIHSTVWKQGDRGYKMVFYNIKEYSNEDMHDKIAKATGEIDDIIAGFTDVAKFLEEHTDWTYHKTAIKTFLENASGIQHVCQWMKETLQYLEIDKTPSRHISKLDGP